MTSKNPLDQEFIAKQRKRLEGLRSDLAGAADAAAAAEIDDQETRGAEAREYEDAAQSLERKEVLQAKHEIDRKRLGNIARALEKIDLGTYGVSDVSGKLIPRARLEAMPEAVTTLDEAAAIE
jgi:DnaK suppressor protein